MMNTNTPFVFKAIGVVAAVVASYLYGAGRIQGPDIGSGGSYIVRDMVDVGLGTAHGRARDDGITLTPYDATGRGRPVKGESDWLICFQSPPAGSYGVGVKALLGVVPVKETCPETDGGIGPVVDGETMPALVGLTVHMARVILGPDASIELEDRKTQKKIDAKADEFQQWIVCLQDPPDGGSYRGQPVSLSAAKKC